MNGVVEQFNEIMELTKQNFEIVEQFNEVMGLLTDEITRGPSINRRKKGVSKSRCELHHVDK